jgi:hypothetical protein
VSRVAIIGSRDATPALLAKVRAYVTQLNPGTVIITGAWWKTDGSTMPICMSMMKATRGVDACAAEAADDHGLNVVMVAGTRRAGKMAGFQRNATILDIADRVVAFWDGKSHGTKQGIDYCRLHDKELLIIRE